VVTIGGFIFISRSAFLSPNDADNSSMKSPSPYTFLEITKNVNKGLDIKLKIKIIDSRNFMK
jgi:hypothetical protein